MKVMLLLSYFISFKQRDFLTIYKTQYVTEKLFLRKTPDIYAIQNRDTLFMRELIAFFAVY